MRLAGRKCRDYDVLQALWMHQTLGESQVILWQSDHSQEISAVLIMKLMRLQVAD